MYGCTMCGDLVARHQRAESSEERNCFRGSKYVQSSIGNAFKQVREDLIKGRYVCFSGMACQIQGLLNYLSEVNTKKLYTICIVCHYVTSPKVLRDYLKMQELKHQGKTLAINFRDKKKYGWEANWETLIIGKKEVHSTYYAQTFYSGLTARECCYQCCFRGIELPGDITIADAWGISSDAPSFNDNKGVSLVLIQNEKGDKWFDEVNSNCVYLKVDVNNYLQQPFIKPYDRPEDRDAFWKIYEERGLTFAFSRYIRTPIGKRVVRKIKRICKLFS